MSELEQTIGYEFSDKRLLAEALRHPSYASNEEEASYERLEFLGDAVIQLVVTDYLFVNFPDAAEGELTRLRARVVSGDGLACLGGKLDLGAHLAMGKGEEKSGGRTRKKVLADAFEALIGAIYVDGGLAAVRSLLLPMLPAAGQLEAGQSVELEDPKSLLQMTVQRVSTDALVYRVVERSGPPHARQFGVELAWKGRVIGHGRGASKKKAEFLAAEQALASRDEWLGSE